MSSARRQPFISASVYLRFPEEIWQHNGSSNGMSVDPSGYLHASECSLRCVVNGDDISSTSYLYWLTLIDWAPHNDIRLAFDT